MADRYLLAGARGGQGTTTVATVLAVLAGGYAATALVAHDTDAVHAIAGLAHRTDPDEPVVVTERVVLTGTGAPAGPADVIVGDLGRLEDMAEPDGGPETTRWLVMRGPCYVSLRAALGSPWRPHGVILVAEKGRSLTPADVADVLGMPVVAQVPVEPSVARLIDAGLLISRLHHAVAFRQLGRLVTGGLHPAYRDAAEAAS